MAGEPLIWNATEEVVEFEGRSFRPRPSQRKGLAILASHSPHFISHWDLTVAIGKTANVRPINEFLKIVPRLHELFGADKRGLKNEKGRIAWLGLIQRTMRVAIGKPLLRADGTQVPMVEAVEFMAHAYGLRPCLRSAIDTILTSASGQYVVLGSDGTGGAMIVLAGRGIKAADDFERITGSGGKEGADP
jgi:hypothetical protein